VIRKHSHTWIVVADGARARFLTTSGDGSKLVPARVADMVAPLNRRPARDLKSDKPGRSYSSSRSGVRHAFEPPHDYHKIEKHRLSAAVAEALHKASEGDAFDRLVLVAPRRSLGELRGLLSDRVKEQIDQAIAKDLTNETAARLWRHLQPVSRRTASVLPKAHAAIPAFAHQV
jgi:protein required for attachment to host cells